MHHGLHRVASLEIEGAGSLRVEVRSGERRRWKGEEVVFRADDDDHGMPVRAPRPGQ